MRKASPSSVPSHCEGTTNGMITDLDGNFSLQCPVGSTLKTSYIGYLARTVKVTGNMNALKITLKEDTETLDEVMINQLFDAFIQYKSGGDSMGLGLSSQKNW